MKSPQQLEIEAALIKLEDIICSYERTTFSGYTLIMIPHDFNESPIISINGKRNDSLSPESAVDFAYIERELL